MKLSREMKLIIAKSGDGSKWLPLWMHAFDTANVIRTLIRLRYTSLAESCGLSFPEFRKNAILLAYLHDIGKITPLFQSQILKSLPERRNIFEHVGINNIFEIINKDKSHHTKCGEAILLNMGFPKGFSSIVGAHHGMPAKELEDYMERYPEHFYGRPKDREFWNGLYEEWADFSLKQAGFADVSEIPAFNKRTEVLLSGLLIMSDWLASNQTNFGLIDEDEALSEDEYPQNRCQNAFEKLKLPEPWEANQTHISAEDFKDRFGFPVNEIQKHMIETVENCEKPGLFILEAPMGIGKTEASLAAAEILSVKCDKTGLFFGLPTQTTANGIFERVVEWVKLQSFDAVHGINLAHGNAEFQPVFAELKKDDKLQTDFDGESGIVVNSFFSGNKLSLLTDFVVGTVDRLLMSALKKKHAMLLHLGLAQKVVVVDECHAYDAYMNKYLDTALAWMHEYGVPVILLSATLPVSRRNDLIKAYLNDKNRTFELPEAAYPRLTYTDNDEVHTVSLPLEIPGRTVNIIYGDDDIVAEEIARAVKEGACIGIICNTVLRAQYFAEIAKKIDGANVILYHAQYIIPDRIEKEEMIKKAIGKSSTAQTRKGTVIVGTQVLEQSLDIDVDILITDLCPMDLLLQRIGRLQRHSHHNRPAGYETPRCIVLGTEEFSESSEYIYTKWLLLRTMELLPENITIPDDIDALVSDTYIEMEPDCEEARMALEKYTTMLKEKQENAKGFLMALPRDSRRGSDLHDWLNNSVSDNENSALATVRDGTFSIEVLVLMQYADGMLGILPWQEDRKKYSPNSCPLDEDCRLIAQQKLRLPVRFCYDIDRTIKELEEMGLHLTGFQKSHWLKGELVLLLNENFNAKLCGCKVTYSRDIGFTYEKEGEE